jgi:hypothetical protein
MAGGRVPTPSDHQPLQQSAGCIICIKLKFNSYVNHSKRIKGKFISLAFLSVYFPCDDTWHDQFFLVFDSILLNLDQTTQIRVGLDINAQIGTRTSNNQGHSLEHMALHEATHAARILSTS